VNDCRLETRTARSRLQPSKQPYWREVSQGAHVGYYRGKRASKWVARFRPLRSASRYRQITLGVADDVEDADGSFILSFQQAQEKARAWFRGVARGVPTGPFTVGEALDDYLASFQGKSLESTRNKVDAILRPGLGSIAVSELTPERIAHWHREVAEAPARLRTSKHAVERNKRVVATEDDRRRRRSTANRYLTVLKAALNQAFRRGRIVSDSAWRRVRPFQNVDAAKLRYLTDDEARKLVAAVEVDFRPLVMAALLTGARYGDLGQARVGDFDAAAKSLRVRNSKGRRPYVAYLSDEATRLFTASAAGRTGDSPIFVRSDGKQWRAGHQRRRLEDAAAAAGIERMCFHDLRRTFGARLAMRGVPMAVIAEVLGHADERTTRRHYAHLAPSYVASTVRMHMADYCLLVAQVVSSTEAA
jgi:integrase